MYKRQLHDRDGVHGRGRDHAHVLRDRGIRRCSSRHVHDDVRDVYKRQVLMLEALTISGLSPVARMESPSLVFKKKEISTPTMITISAVSYTHLDVYKRQLSTC